ncbi:MAG TPA: aspartate kinase [Holophagaceae bacterium]|jgi:aspartate kinase|nr:aspartate kinase [Holophagaceae bacterium]
MTLKVLKFGGSSVGNAEALLRAAAIIRAELPEGGLVVVSAMKGATDGILAAVEAAGRSDGAAARRAQEGIRRRHEQAANALELLGAVEAPWNDLFERLSNLLAGMAMLGEATPRARDAALGVGESLSAHLVTALLERGGTGARFRDARAVLKTDARFGQARPQPALIRRAAEPWRRDIARGARIITQGFIGESPDGATTTLGRGGSDTSATLLGEALGAEEVQIWTDVDGVLSADPSLVPEARPLPVMSLAEATALSAFGAKVLHADSLAPLARAGFRLVVANTLRPEASRTSVLAAPPLRAPGEVTSVAYKEGLTLLRLPAGTRLDEILQHASSLDEAGARRFGLLANPEGALMALLPETPAAESRLAAMEAEGFELQRGWAVVALVGEGLRQDPGAALRLLAALRHEPIGGLLTGSSGVSVAFLVPEARLPDLIPSLHAACIAFPEEAVPAGP